MKNYPCPYCGEKMHRDDLVKHVEKKHDDMIPENWTAYRVVYDLVNDKHGHGTCTECGEDTKWNEKRQKYERLCGKKECYEKVRKRYEGRMIKVYGKHQEKMLANRRIAGKYKWSDGREFIYMGSYEKELLEFLDKVMEYDSKDIIAPGPILEYEFKGKKLHWITDIFIIPNRIVIEVKDGGDNPNKRFMPEYRAKQIAKEKMITSLGKMSYLRLTNNNFAQLMSILAELKMQVVEDKTGPIYRIHESASEEDILLELNSIYNSGDDMQRLLKSFDEGFITIHKSGKLLDDEAGEVGTYYEAALISPVFKHKSMESLFESIVQACVHECEKVYTESVHWEWLNPFNHMDGVSIGLKTF